MAVVGLCVGAFEFYVYMINKREYRKIVDEFDELRRPMMNTTMSMSTINSRHSAGISQTGIAHGGTGHMINFGPHPAKLIAPGPPNIALNPSQRQLLNHTPSIGGNSSIGGALPQLNASNQQESSFVNPLQSIHNTSGRFPPMLRNQRAESDRIIE